MINFNGKLVPKKELSLSIDNRAFKYGDALFETIKVENGKVVFLEDHYFRLMASMRMLRMRISMEFTLEFFESEILKLLTATTMSSARVRFSVNRNNGGRYLPLSNETHFLIEAEALTSGIKEDYEVDLFKDHYVYTGILSTIKTNNKILNVIASIYADENGLDNCILINEHKRLVEAVNANIFLVKDQKISTPALSEGCLKGIVRKKILEILAKNDNYEISETEISPFELQKADEVFLSNSIMGIQPISKYRKKVYTSEVAVFLQEQLKILEKLS